MEEEERGDEEPSHKGQEDEYNVKSEDGYLAGASIFDDESSLNGDQNSDDPQRADEADKEGIVPSADAGADPRTMMVEPFNTRVAFVAM